MDPVAVISKLREDLTLSKTLDGKEPAPPLEEQLLYVLQPDWRLDSRKEVESMIARLARHYEPSEATHSMTRQLLDWLFKAFLYTIHPFIKPFLCEIADLSTRQNLTYAKWLCSFLKIKSDLASEALRSKESRAKVEHSLAFIETALASLQTQQVAYATSLREHATSSEKQIADSWASISNLEADFASAHTHYEGVLATVQKSLASLQVSLASLKEDQAESAASQRNHAALAAKEMTTVYSDLDKLRDKQTASEAATEARLSCNLLATMKDTSPIAMAYNSEGAFIAITGDRISETLLKGQLWDEHLLTFIDAHPFPAKTLAIDVGANIGSLTVPLARRFEKVIAIEPQAYAMNILQSTCFINSLTNVRFHNACVWSCSGKATPAPICLQDEYTLETNGTLSFRKSINLGATSFVASHDGNATIQMFSLDSLELDHVDLIKIDAQGADGLIIQGAMQLLRTFRPVVLFEWENELSQQYGSSFDEIASSLIPIGYTIQKLYQHNQKQADYVAFIA